jgi:heme/copper-type cytochrome/quinol oxidase subunit 3
MTIAFCGAAGAASFAGSVFAASALASLLSDSDFFAAFFAAYAEESVSINAIINPKLSNEKYLVIAMVNPL